METRFYVAPREGHQWRELRHQIFKANAELEWFDRHVMGRTYRVGAGPRRTAPNAVELGQFCVIFRPEVDYLREKFHKIGLALSAPRR